MIINVLKQLSEQEADKLFQAPALITVLIAAADGEIEQKEINWGSQIVKFRDSADSELYNYYNAVAEIYDEQVKAILAEDHIGNQERLASLTSRLQETGPLLSQINKLYADKLFQSWQSFARGIAKSTGGFLGFGDIADQEEALMDLHMIQY